MLLILLLRGGVSGGWTYRKWNSGILECWFSDIYTFPVGTSSGSGIEGIGLQSTDIPLPSEISFTNKPCCTGSVDWYFCEWITCSFHDNSIQVRVYCNGNSANTTDKFIDIHCIGRWK